MIDYARLKDYSIEELLNTEIECECGRIHKVATEKILIGDGVSSSLKSQIDEKLPVGTVLVITCEDIFEKISKPLIESIKSENRTVLCHKFKKNFSPKKEVADELFEFDETVRCVVSIGSGCVTDCGKYFAKERNIPFIAVATAPSMDGYISNTSVILVDGVKQSLLTKSPEVLICDIDIMKTAPSKMIASGYGDVASKYMAIFDWHIANKFTQEYFCPHIARMTIASADLAIIAGQEIILGKKEGYFHLVEALLKSSVAMQLLGTTRCASGAEHNSAHVLNMIERNLNKTELLHGEEVFLMYAKLVPIYNLFFKHQIADTSLFPDMDRRYQMLIDQVGLAPLQAEKLTSHIITPNAYKYMKKVLADTRQFFSDSIDELIEQLPMMMKIFASLYDNNEGNWIKKYDTNKIKWAIVLSTEIKPKFVTLNIMKYLGLLENYLV